MLHAEQPARLDDVLRYLRLQGLDAGEPALLAQPVHELDAHAPIIDVLREVEKVDLERERRLTGPARPYANPVKYGDGTESTGPPPQRATSGEEGAARGRGAPRDETVCGAEV